MKLQGTPRPLQLHATDVAVLPRLLSAALAANTGFPSAINVYLSLPAAATATASLDAISQHLGRAYVHLSAATADRPDLPLNVYLLGLSAPPAVWSLVWQLDGEGGGVPRAKPWTAHRVPPLALPVHHYAVAAVGGTFDHLHAGHRQLLSRTALCVAPNGRLVCGLVADALLAKKAYASEMQAYAAREAAVQGFVARFAPGVVVEVVPLMDAFGPAATMSELEVLVATVETAANSHKINEERAKRGLGAIAIDLIPVISSANAEEADMGKKLSSTGIREWLHTQGQQSTRGSKTK
ncbi:hypothetical protein H9P43_001519 [Blastocladiella emersonii ATCC 22665]|nr:hypothetical protein H9P43_001519 [Blastocladiella emersonii ATCC 22665]